MSIETSTDENGGPENLTGREGTSATYSLIKLHEPKKLFKTIAISVSFVITDPSGL